MNQTVNPSRLFLASCLALITTAFSFSIRAGILPQLGTEFGLTAEQLGFINSMWFLGFPIAMIVGGLVYNTVGPKIIMNVAFVCHSLGILLTIFAGGYSTLLISTLFIGIGNGCTEAACNPMIADMYTGTTMNKMLNRFHMWFPGGIVVGSLISLAMTKMGMSWQTQVGIIMIPTLIYAFLFWGQAFPKAKVEGAMSLSENFKAMINPLYLFIFACMAITAISEFGPQQWTALILSKSGAEPLLILALVTGLMAVGRYFGGPIIHRLDQTGVLLGGAVFATIGIYLFSTQTGAMAYVAAIFFAVGVCYFWPTMIGFVAERIPLSGALGMSIVGGVGMFSTSIWQPIIGGWIDSARVEKAASGLSGDALELAAGQATLLRMTTFPIILIVAFTLLWFWMRNRKAGHVDESVVLEQPQL
ncbi:MFS transporter [Spirosoma linguale]|uniref:Major facilitator superfamily MFS_1 n=1 Tax=Spirosoma linguale (strain ATCC 33905 / DSM 74 / LMG 10896 / Claus 1) TaxID=504472 RepID=D2QPD7_SPILD|nr:major facilitator superfamily MFS_1 [Spirosoma linguale DSM 74]